MDIELQAAGNRDGVNYRPVEETERDWLVSTQNAGNNGEMMPSGNEAVSQKNLQNTHIPQENSTLCRIKRDLNEVVFWKVKVWMIIIISFLVILAVIFISVCVCSAVHEDEEEKFDPSLPAVAQYFNGSFQLAFEQKLVTLSSSESQADLQKTLADLYRSSPALAQYFSKAEIYGFRNGSVDYRLTFLIPEAHQDQLRKFTLSREVVYNVFRQFLYDQEQDKSGQMYIDPVSLIMI
ncbi:TPA-induced transmembrane protein [Mastacembelus armatus]|uniref:Chromosome 13 C3orf52 homolog n=1 Tax=Mastacembelus armatus TaxID=205130 RepID=A0A3Q3S561_9TELE|nr:TPA-induced transmembrane protein [Mastacembelus armatus]